MRYNDVRQNSLEVYGSVRKTVFKYRQVDVSMLIRASVEHEIRSVVCDGIDEKVSDHLRSWWGYDRLKVMLDDIDRYLVTSRVLEEL